MKITSQASAQDHVLLEPDVPALLDASSSDRADKKGVNNLDWRQSVGIGLATFGALALILGWYGVSGTTNTAQQLSYFISGGLGGAGMLFGGMAFLNSYEHSADRETLKRLNGRLDRLEFGIASEFDALRAELMPTNGTADTARWSR